MRDDPLRQRAQQRAKLAVLAYEREPSDKNEREVESAWRWIQRLDAMDEWRAAGRPRVMMADPSKALFRWEPPSQAEGSPAN